MQCFGAMGSAQRTPNFWLVLAERVVPLREGVMVVGRSVETDVCFPEDSTMSRTHARLEISAEHVKVSDLGSANGTWLNGHRIAGREVMTPGDRLLLGDTELVLHPVGADVGRNTSNPTTPEAPLARARRASRPVDGATERKLDFERGLLDIERALEEGRVREARQHFAEYMAWLDVTAERASPELVSSIAALALRLATAMHDGSYANWVSNLFRRLQRPIDKNLVDLAQTAADHDVFFDYRAFDVRKHAATAPVATH